MESKYNISIWEDIDNGASFVEKKIAEIGSNTMTAPSRALEPVLTENSNGTRTFTFKMYYVYVDPVTGEKVDNPLCNLMVNERKVKVFWKDKWYDFIIKDVTKDSSNKTLTFNCQDLFINELSKNGFNLEFDAELENNIGTIDELAEKVLEGTSWTIEGDSGLHQFQEDALYEVTSHGGAISAVRDLDGTSVQIPSNGKIYVFYNSYSAKHEEGGKVQFLYGTTALETADGSNVIIDNNQDSSSNWYSYTAMLGSFSGSLSIYRGRRVVKSTVQEFDEKLGKYVSVHTTTSSSIYYIDETTSIETPQTVANLIANNNNFSSLACWEYTGTGECSVQTRMYPAWTGFSTTQTDLSNYDGKGYLYIKKGTSINVINRGLAANIMHLPDEGLQPGQKYVLESKVYSSVTSGSETYPSTSLVSLGFSGIIGTTTTSSDVYFTNETDNIWKVNRAASIADINQGQMGFVFTPSTDCWVEDIQFFPYVETSDSVGYIQPNNFATEYVVKPIFNVYDKSESEKEPEERTYIYQGETLPSQYTPDTDTTKRRSITIKESNRFNIIQTLAETFNCWAIFNIEHNSDGSIIPGTKTISFKERLGEETGLGFVYGIDLKSVSRNLNSNNIVTKTIVKQNSNEFGKDGFCTIARAEENYPLENFVLNFNYYINQGLLNAQTVNNDLYDTTSPNIGYLAHLHEYNSQYDSSIEELVQKKQVLTQTKSLLSVKELNLNALNQEILEKQSEVQVLLDVDSWAAALSSDNINKPSPDGWIKVKADIESIKKLEEERTVLEEEISNLQSTVTSLKNDIGIIETTQETIITNKENLNAAFFAKYESYLQEGTWISEDYYDDGRYYLDACDVAATSAEPQLSYSINVLRVQDSAIISGLDDFRAKKFNIGDTVFIQDPEYFGYTYINAHKTPVRKKVLISQIVSNFDDPSKDTITIQNYKTDFEDLFQRITASTQSLQYSSGSYNRAAAIVSSNGTIDADVLQTSLSANNNLVFQSLNNNITQDATGISLVDLTNPNNRVKITATGLFISTDGGQEWKNAIRGNGIATQYLTAGNISTKNINIYGDEDNWPSYRWDIDGITAYYKDGNGTDWEKFVRFNQYGLYGADADSPTDSAINPTSENDIWTSSATKFALTWKGFMLKSNGTDGYISITSDDDIQVMQNAVERVKIGRVSDVGESPIVYGIRINDSDGNSVIESNSDGKVWLKDKLKVGDGSTSTTEIGYNSTLDTITLPNGTTTQAHKVISSDGGEEGYHFYVYDNGYVDTNAIVVDSAYVNGTVIAHSGYFGENAVIRISEDALTVFDNSNNLPLAKIDQNGFSAYGAGLTIYDSAEHDDPPTYVSTFDTEIVPNKQYYILTYPDGQDQPGVFQLVADPQKSELPNYFEEKFKNGEVLLEYNKDTGLYINGNGTFNGNGSFSGRITATEGQIGGFTITTQELYSNSGTLTLNGENGEITALKGNIGGFTLSENSLISGDLGIYSDRLASDGSSLGPRIEIGDDVVLESNKGTFGNIVINGETSTISGANFTITPITSTFNNIVATGEIRTAVYAQDSVQAVGSQMIFRPTYKINNIISTNPLKVESEELLNVGDSIQGHYFFIVDEKGKKKQCVINKVDNIYFEVTPINAETLEDTNYVFVIDLGNPNESLSIGINSGEGDGNNLIGEGITFNLFSILTNNNVQTVSYNEDPNVFLGNLNNLSVFSGADKGFGLYSTNVFLKGSLTTKYNQEESIKYAGINTLGAAAFNWHGKKDTPAGLDADESPIIFWAGSNSSASNDVQLSPFQVTSNGTLYANQAYITGSIISKSILQGTELWTAKIRGYDGEGESDAPLEIYNTTDWIKFYNSYPNGSPSLEIGKDGIRALTEIFIDYSNQSNGIQFKTGSYILNKNGLGITDHPSVYTILPNGTAEIIAEENGDNISKFTVAKGQIGLNNIPQFSYKDTFYYKNTSKGYDLYVLS